MLDHPGRFLAVLVYLYYYLFIYLFFFFFFFFFTPFPSSILGIAVSPCPILFPFSDS